jgi:hypothetical protein
LLQRRHVVFRLTHVFRLFHRPAGAADRRRRLTDIAGADCFPPEKRPQDSGADRDGRLDLTAAGLGLLPFHHLFCAPDTILQCDDLG